MRGKPHSPETRAQVLAALLAGQGVMDVAREYQLDEATVRNWKRTIPGERLTEINAKKAHDFGDQLAGYLGEVLTSLRVQAEFFRDTAWLAKQDASEAAVLHGVMVDKAVRLLEAAEPSPEPGDDEP